MKIFFPKLINLLLVLVLLNVLSVRVEAENRDIRTYHPSVVGQYSLLRVLPWDPLLPAPAANCTVGMLYSDSNGSLRYCHKDAANIGQGEWGGVSFIWAQGGTGSHHIYLTNTTIYSQLKLGIGTSSPDFKLTLQTDPGILALGTFGAGATLPNNLGDNSRLIWYPRKAAYRAGYVAGNLWENNNIGDYSVAMGRNSKADGSYSFVGGGDGNTASGVNSFIGGGGSNSVTVNDSAIAGGQSNRVTGTYSMIWGGQANQATANYTVITGGNSNQATANYSAVGGGDTNRASTPYSVIHGGRNNLANYTGNGGATGYSTISGGNNNRARHNYTVISGGDSNIADAQYATIGGGFSNTASGPYSTVLGGRENTASGDYALVGGGYQNTASGNYSVVGGGERNTASGHHAMILGGLDNIAGGNYSWANGRNVQLSNSADRTFAWGYSDDNSNRVTINASDAFIIAPGRISNGPWNPKIGIRDSAPGAVLEINNDGAPTAGFRPEKYLKITKRTNSGNLENVLSISLAGDPTGGIPYHTYIGVGVNADVANLSYAMKFGNANNAYLTAAGVWVPASSRRYKENIRPLTSIDAENTLDQLSAVSFNYNPTPHETNLGFIAEDVPEIVAMENRKSLTNLDFIAVLTKTIQDQQNEIKNQNSKIEAIQNKINALKAKLEE